MASRSEVKRSAIAPAETSGRSAFRVIHRKGAAARSSARKVLLLPVVLEGDLADLPGLLFRHLAVLRPLEIAGALALGSGQLFAHENPLRFPAQCAAVW